MKQSLSFLATMTQQLIEKAQHISDLSLWNGKMGIVIYLFHVALPFKIQIKLDNSL